VITNCINYPPSQISLIFQGLSQVTIHAAPLLYLRRPFCQGKIVYQKQQKLSIQF